MIFDAGIGEVEMEMEQYEKLCESYLNRVKEIRNSILTALGFLATVILGLASVNFVNAYVVETLIAIGIIAVVIFIGINLLHVRKTQNLGIVTLGFYVYLKMLQVSKGEMVGLSLRVREMPLKQIQFMILLSVLIAAAGSRVLLDRLSRVSRSFVVSDIKGYFEFKIKQIGPDYKLAEELYKQNRDELKEQQGIVSPKLMSFLEIYEKGEAAISNVVQNPPPP